MINSKYKIPYSSVTETNLYHREYYKLSKDTKKNKYIKTGDYTKDKINNKQSNHNPITYDKEGILKETEDYIIYINKVWSKSRDRYLKGCSYKKKYNSYCCIMGRYEECKLIILNDYI